MSGAFEQYRKHARQTRCETERSGRRRCRHAALGAAHSCRFVWRDRRHCDHRCHVPMACDSTGARGNFASLGISSTSEGTGCTCGAPGTARLPSSSTRASAAQLLAGASSNLMLLDSRVSAPTTAQVWATAIPARRRGPHAASRASWPSSSPAAGLTDRRCSSGPPSRVSVSASSRPITPSAPPVSCSWMPPTKTTHMTCR